MPDRSDQVEGKVKEVAGKVTGDDKLESEGRTERATEDTKEKLESGADRARGAAEAVKDKLRGQ